MTGPNPPASTIYAQLRLETQQALNDLRMFSQQVERRLSQVGGVFTSGPVVGTLAAGVTAGIAAGISAALPAAVSTGALAGGIALAFQDKRISDSFAGLGVKMADQLKESASRNFVDPLLGAGGLFDSAFERMMPRIDALFAQLAPGITPIAEGLVDGIERALPGIEKMIALSGPIFEDLGETLSELGETINVTFTHIAEKNGPAMIRLFGDLTDVVVVLAQAFAGLLIVGSEFAEKSYAIWDGIKRGAAEAAAVIADVAAVQDLMARGQFAVAAGVAAGVWTKFNEGGYEAQAVARDLGGEIRQVEAAAYGAGRAFETLNSSVASAADKAKALGQIFGELYDPQVDLNEATEAYQAALDELRDSHRGNAEEMTRAQERITRAVENTKLAQERAARSMADASERVVDAKEREKEAELDLVDARKDAMQQLKDLQRQVLETTNKEESARIRLAEAEIQYRRTQKEKQFGDLDKRKAALDLAEAQQGLTDVLADNAKVRIDLAEAQRKGVEGSDQVIGAQKKLNQSREDTRDAERGVADARRDGARSIRDARRAEQDARNSYKGSNITLQEKKDLLEQSAEASYQLLQKEIAAGDGSAAAISRAIKAHEDRLKKIANEGVAAGIARGEVERLIEMYGRWGGNRVAGLTLSGYESIDAQLLEMLAKQMALRDSITVEEARKRIKGAATINSFTSGIASGAISTGGTNNPLDLLLGRGSTASIRPRSNNPGGPVRFLADGGHVWGPGTETSDSIPARLSKNEYVHRAKAVRYYGTDLMDKINRQEIPRSTIEQAFAQGGLVEKWPYPINLSKTQIPTPSATAIRDQIIGTMANFVGGMLGGGGNPGTGKFPRYPNGWPTRQRGRVSPNTAAAQAFIRANWGIPSHTDHTRYLRTNDPYDHSWGKALDNMTSAFTPKGKATGNSIASWFIQNPAKFGTKYVIWNRQVTSGGGWHPYSGASPHTDHVHVSLFKKGGLAGKRTEMGPQLPSGSAYDRGGVLPPGYRTVYNGTGRDEYIATTRADLSGPVELSDNTIERIVRGLRTTELGTYTIQRMAQAAAVRPTTLHVNGKELASTVSDALAGELAVSGVEVR